jgi:hypothetical protein
MAHETTVGVWTADAEKDAKTPTKQIASKWEMKVNYSWAHLLCKEGEYQLTAALPQIRAQLSTHTTPSNAAYAI